MASKGGVNRCALDITLLVQGDCRPSCAKETLNLVVARPEELRRSSQEAGAMLRDPRSEARSRFPRDRLLRARRALHAGGGDRDGHGDRGVLLLRHERIAEE